MIVDVNDCLLCNAGCCNNYETCFAIKNNILVCVDADSNIQLYLILDSTLMQLTVVDIRRNPPQSADV